jgi:hypothetical protein
MTTEKHLGAGHGNNAYNESYFMKKFGLSEAEVLMALREINHGSPQELEDYLQLKYTRSADKQ